MGKWNYIAVLFLVLLASYLRFTNLGYSEFQDDEKKAIIRVAPQSTIYEFLINQRKGPLQFGVTSAVLAINPDKQNELGLRLPFTVINLLSVAVFYFLVLELVKSRFSAFIGTLLYLSNGFIVGFSRIAQYQSLNLLFSLVGIFLLIKLYKTNRHFLLFSNLGVLSFVLSLMSHWDVIFIVVPALFYYLKFLVRKDVAKEIKIKVFISNLFFGCILVLPFLIPYIKNQLDNGPNREYFQRRVAFSTYGLANHKYLYELYNPFVSLYLLATLSLFSFIRIKKSLLVVVWFAFNFVTIFFLMAKPGTHIYNYVIPFILLATLGFSNLIELKILKKPATLIVCICTVFLYWQSYVLFVDHTKEYPWEDKQILKSKTINLTAPKINTKEIITFGFPHYRNWKHVAQIILNDNPDCMYLTNEGKSISQVYLPDNYGFAAKPRCFYIVSVTRPFFIEGNDAVFAETTNKRPVYKYVVDDETLLRLYKIR